MKIDDTLFDLLAAEAVELEDTVLRPLIEDAHLCDELGGLERYAANRQLWRAMWSYTRIRFIYWGQIGVLKL